MKAIKVIDLYDKILNGEEIPKKIKYDEYIYSYVERNKLFAKYIREPFNAKMPYYLFTEITSLSDLVEIIEDTPKEEKKIEKLGAFNIKKFYDDYPETAQFILEMFKKQEELIDKVNGEDNE